MSHPDYTQWGQNGHYEIYPGTYCGGLTVSNGVTAHFNPGVYVVNGGGIQFGSGAVTGTGVTFYITGTSFTNNELVSINNGETVNLSAPTSGTYQGILFLQDRTINNSALSSNFAGGATMALTGALDFPTTALQFNNGSSSTANVALIARTINLQGGVGVKLDGGSPILPPVTVAVTPSTTTLYGGQSQQFSASVANGCTGTVAWSISPASGEGTINSSGLYTAPSTVSTQQTVTVTATSQSDTTKTATATITLMPPVSVTVSPTAMTLYGNQSQQFTATVANAVNPAVIWSITPSSGAGTISATGQYTAPATISSTRTVTVIATSQQDTTKSAAAVVTLEPPVTVLVSPATATLYGGGTQQFTATVGNATNSAVTWSVSPAGAGTISGSGLYTAPAAIAAQQTVTVTATSQVDSSKSASSTATLLPPVSVTVTPATGSLNGGQTLQFAASVANTGNTAVSWSIAPAGTGSISASGLYTAPAVIPSQTSVTVTATSQADSTKTASAVVTLNPVTVSAAPGSALLYAAGTQQFTATVGNTANSAVTWSVSPAGAGSVSASGLYTAPSSITSQQTVTVTATSQADTTKTASASVTLSPPISVTVSPQSATLYAGQTQQFAATVINATTTAVTWSATAGTINASGLYTAPTSIGSQQTVTVTAKSQADNTTVGSATVTLMPPITVTVSPATVTLNAGQTQTFTAAVSNASTVAVTWSASLGTINASGLYTAPATVVGRQTATITAKSQADNTTIGTATVTLLSPITVSVTPATANVYAGQTKQFTATVSNDPSNAGVTWTVSPATGAGSISTSGVYTAPATVVTQQTVTITATSVTDGTKSASATVTLLPAITVTVAPATANVYGGQTKPFTATLTNDPSNAGVTWSVSPATGAGSISTSGVYTAPATVAAQQTVIVTATSQADGSTGTATITLTLPITVTLDTSAITLYAAQTHQFTATVANTTNTAVTWSIPQSAPGSISTTGLYTAPATIATQQAVTVTATSQADNTTVGTATVTLSPAITVTLDTTAVTLYGAQTHQFMATVANATNAAVTWSIPQSAPGSISTTGIYTAPATISAQQTVTVTATSQADNTTTGTATITLEPPIVITVSPAAAILSISQTQQFTATVTNVTNNAVNWSISPAGTGTISTTGLYTAPASIAAQQAITITATSAADGTTAFAASVTLTPCALSPYSHVRAIVIDHTKVPNTDQINFPVLISGTYSYLANAANGGGVQSANGYDIIFTSDFAGTNKLDHELESYNPATGAITAWVRIPTLSHTADTVIYLNYGNPTITTSQQNRPGVWDSNYQAVIHFTQLSGTYSGSVSDSTGVHNDLNNIAGSLAGGVGPFDGAAVLTGSQYLYRNAPTGFSTGSAPRTVESWVKSPASGSELAGYGTNNSNGHRFAQNWSGTCFATEVENDGRCATFPLADGNWHHVVSVLPAGKSTDADILLYGDGALLAGSGGSITLNTDQGMFAVGTIPGALNNANLTGSIAEVRVSNSDRSADWIATEYASIHSPATFYTIDAENQIGVTVAPASASLYASQTQQFAAATIGNCSTGFTWVITPTGAGTITTSGLYTAPPSVPTQQPVTITATSTLDPTKSSNATVTLLPPIVVSVAPLTATLTAAQSQQFTATGQTGPIAVTWSVTPPSAGAITASGLFTAATMIVSQQVVTITATAVLDTTRSGSATVTLQPSSFVSLRMRAVGPTYTDPVGRTWTTDVGFAGLTEQCNFFASTTFSFIVPAGVDGEYGAGRWCNGDTFDALRYQFAVPNGNYQVTLKFADPTFGNAGQRVFSASINGATPTALSHIDVAGNAGGQYKPYDIPTPVTVTGGQINIAFTPQANTPILNAIEIVAANSVEVLPSTATLSERQLVSFSALTNGLSSNSVTWSILPANAGSISSSGVYSAPATISTSTTVTIIATSAANLSVFGIAVVTLAPTDPNSFVPVRINSGGPTYTDPAGRIWTTDIGSSALVQSCNTFASTTFSFTPPAGLDNEYASGRWCHGDRFNSLGYQIPVPNMDYLVTLKFADPSYVNPGQRIFNATVNNVTTTALSNIDVAASSGGQFKTYDVTMPVTVTGGTINIALTPLVDTPILNAVEIVPATSVEVLPHTATLTERQILSFSALTRGVSNNSVTWSIAPATAGSIASDGTYSAPATISATTTVTVTATSVANPNLFGTAIVTLSPSDPNTFAPIRINTGGPTYTDPAGRVWTTDIGSPLLLQSCNTFASTIFSYTAPNGLDNEYGFGRWCSGDRFNSLGYQIPVPNMDYLVTLKFADPIYANAGQRVFNASINGSTTTALSNIDVAASAGGKQKSYDIITPVTVTGGQIGIALTALVDTPILNAVEIVPASSVEVLPRTATLTERQILQFGVITHGLGNGGVTWSVSPATAGSITASGIYTSPSMITASTTVTITATSVLNPNVFGVSTVTLSPADPNTFVPLRISASGPTYTDPAGRVWTSDIGFSGLTQQCNTFAAYTFAFTPPAGLDNEYGAGRWCHGDKFDALTYQFPVPNMDYLVTLKFADPSYANAGQRVFNASINGSTTTALAYIDVAASAGGQFKPYDITTPVTVANGQIVINFTPQVDTPIINAIEIVAANSVEVLPHTATLTQRQILQFSAVTPGLTNNAVTWSISPTTVGSITAAGLYTAPATINTSTTVTITATSVANPNLFGVASVTLAAADPNTFVPLRISASGPTYVDPAGRVWTTDIGFAGLTQQCNTFAAYTFAFTPPAGLDNEYGAGRWCHGDKFDALTYQFPVPNMDYLVTLKFADPSYAGAGQRIFAASINGTQTTALSHIDVAGSSGGQYKSYDITTPVTVTNGQISINFLPQVDTPIINAIEIVAANSVEVVPGTATLTDRQILQFSALTPGLSNSAVTWSISPTNLGAISAAGLYTAPASITAAATVTVTATSAANPNLFGVATVSLSPADPSTVSPLRISVNGPPTYTDPAGRVWTTDIGFSGLTQICNTFASTTFSFTPPAGLDNEYAAGRWCHGDKFDALSYQFGVPNMDYLVTLKFADPSYGSAGQRIFAASINGIQTTALSHIDVAGSSGGQYKAYDITTPVIVTGGQITIAFTPQVDTPIINAIEIVPVASIQINPTSVTMAASQTQQFTAVDADPLNPTLVWSIAPANTGSITSTGLYTAPSPITTLQQVTVTVADPLTGSSASASINLLPPGTVGVSPTMATVLSGGTQQFTATVGDNFGTSVTWTLTGPGTVSSTGLYTAPVIYTPQTAVVTASLPGGATSSATINIVPSVTVSINPASGTLGPGQTQQFTAAVNGAWNTSVTWIASSGTISATGLYTAPSTIGSTTSASITATSTVNSNISGTVVLTLVPTTTIVVTPGTVQLSSFQTQQFTATGASGFNWSINPSIGTISSTGLYTAPNVVLPQIVTVTATNSANTSQSGVASSSLMPAVTNSYSYRRAIDIDHTKVVNSDQSNFAVLVSGTYSYLANVANGGKVQNANGYDIVFSSDCAGDQQLAHEIASYNPATGAVSFWVLLPNVSHTIDTVFYMSYGNSSITASQENRPPVDAARSSTGRSSDWTATTAHNQSSPSTFYTIYGENTNTVAPPTAALGPSQTQQFLPLFTVGAAATSANPLVLVGTSPTPSAAESVALSADGHTAYVCDNNEVSIFDVTNPASPLFKTGAVASSISNDGFAHCTIQNRASGPVLMAFVDAVNSTIGNNPAFVAFSLQNPTSPQLIGQTAVSKRFFEIPVYSNDGNTAFIPTFAVTFFLGNWSGQFGDVVAVDVTNLAAPAVVGTMEPAADATLGGSNVMFGAAFATSNTLLVGGSTSTGTANAGVGELVVADVTNPKAISVVTTVPVPGTKQIFTPVLQGNLAVALGDTGGWEGTIGPNGPTATFLGSLAVTTFNITNPRSPSVISTVTLPYSNITVASGPAIQIGTNLFLFGGALDSKGNNLLLLVDTTNRQNPSVTSYIVPASITHMVVSGNLLHVTAGGAGYAVYQIPGVTGSQFGLTGACGQPVTWTLNPATAGSITALGIYTAPASIPTNQIVTVTATGQYDPTMTASATVNLSNTLTLSLTAAPGPYVAGANASITATVTSSGATPVSGATVTFTVTGTNARTGSATTDANGRAVFTYSGARGTDTIQASSGGFSSNTVSAVWVSPANPITTTPVTAEFFTATSCPSGCEAFNTPPTQVPVFIESFPNIMFDPFPGALANNSAGVGSTTRPFTDIILNSSGQPTGTLLAQGNGAEAGNGTLAGFSAVFSGSLVVAQAGSYTVNIGSADGFILGIGNGAARVSGVNVNPPSSGLTAFSQYPVVGANNGPSTNAPAPIVVSFPAAGSYPYELDYKSGTGLALSLSLTVTQGSSTVGIGPLESLVLTSNTLTPLTGQQASFSVQATDETGAPIASLPITFNVAGVSPQTLHGTTNASGAATFSYTESTAMTDVVQASALINGMQLVTADAVVAWKAAIAPTQAPLITIDGPQSITLPNTASYTATVTDPTNGGGGAISTVWSQLGGPATVGFSSTTQTSTTVTFPTTGVYMLQIVATDTLGARTVQVGPVTVNPPISQTLPSGWIASPGDHSQLTGVVPVVLISTETLVSGTLSFYPTSNSNAVTVLNPTTTGGGTIGNIDTTLLSNGSYTLLLQATDTSGKTQTSGLQFLVGGDYKPGRVTTTVTDLIVPAPGLPIPIQRTYDSLQRSSTSDFGNGWSLGMNVQLEVSAEYDVTLTINNQRRTFYFTPYIPGFTFTFNGQQVTQPNILGVYFPSYTPEPGLYGSLAVWQNGSNLIGSNTGCLFDWLLPVANSYFCYGNAGSYSPGGYIYTDPYGRVYTISATGGLQSIKDLAGNTLTVTPNGITASNGLSVPFVRDAQGRITQITDTLGNVYKYGYDANGNLSSVSYPGITTATQYTYDTTHLYTGGTDGNNNPLPSTTYFSDGRVQTSTDGLGHTWNYSYDLSGRTETQINPDGGKLVKVMDAYGRPTTITDPLGRTATYAYDTNHNPLSYTNPLGKTRTLTYDSSGNITSLADPLGNRYSWTYGGFSQKLTETDPLGHTKQFAYDINAYPTSITDGLGQSIGTTWSGKGQLAAIKSANGATTSFTYDIYGNQSSITINNGSVQQMQYDLMGRWTGATDIYHGSLGWGYNQVGLLTSETDPLGHAITYSYDANGNRTQEVDRNGGIYTHAYDIANRPTGTTYPDGKSISATYDYAGRPLTLTDEGGRVTTNVYDVGGQLLSTTLATSTPDQAIIKFGYDLAGRTTSKTDALGNTTTMAYDDADRLVSITDPLGQVTTIAYDGESHMTSRIETDGSTTSFAHDERGRVTQVTKADGGKIGLNFGPLQLQSKTDELGHTTKYAYTSMMEPTSVTDANGNTFTYVWTPTDFLSSIVDPNGHVTSFKYDAADRVISRTFPDGSTEQYGYDADGNVTSMMLADGHVNQLSYDGRRRPTLIQYFDGSSVSITYTPTGKRQSITNSAGVTQYQYDNLDRLTKYTQADGQVVTYTYDANNNVLTRTTPAGTITFTYDKLNRCISVSDSAHGTVSFTYDARNRITAKTLPNGIVTNYTYDAVSRVTHIGHSVGTAAPFQSFDYTFDPVGNRLQATEADGTTTRWAYDALNEVTQETVADSSGTTTRSTGFAYDPAGNILSRTDNGSGTSFQYNNLDQLLSAGAKSFTYDPRGNVASITDSSGMTTLGYDAANHLISAVKPGGAGSAGLTYDGESRRISQAVNGVATQMLWDPTTDLGDVVMEASGSSVLASYAFGPNGLLWRGAGNTTSYYLHDGLGSVIGLTSPAGALTDQYRYDAYGQPTLTNGSTPNPYRYRGEWTDSFTGFQYLRARFYNPSTGRFLTRDRAPFDFINPIDFNRYRYAASNPVNASDPSGEQSALEWIMLKLNIQDRAALGEYAGQRATESVAAAALDEFGDMAASMLISALGNAVLKGAGVDAFGDTKIDKWVTVSSARAVARIWDTEIFPGMVATRKAEIIGQIPSAYDTQPRKNFAAVSGLRPSSKSSALSLAISIEEILEELFQDSDVDVANGSVGANSCTNHAERKIVRKADGRWTILGIGASRDICLSCRQAIRSNSPAAIALPLGIKPCVPKQ